MKKEVVVCPKCKKNLTIDDEIEFIRKKKKTPKKEKAPIIEKVSTPPQPSKTIADNKKIRLSSKEEARRAFIYSEIFNRKY